MSNHNDTKTSLGMGNVDNTHDMDKPVSTAESAALALKVDKTTTVNGHALNTNVSVTKGDVGLGTADNTSDVNKPISTATQAALNTKEPAISLGTTKQYFRGDKTWQTQKLTKAGTATIAGGGGQAIIYLTDTGLVGGNALFSTVDYVHLDFVLNNPNLGKSYTISGDLKTLTITAVTQAFTGISILSIPVLGSVSLAAAANGVQLSVLVQGNPA